MRRMLLLASLVLLSASAARAEPGETKEFKAKNFKWTLPSKDWSFLATTPEQTAAGYVAAVECRADGGVRAFARVVANGPTAEAVAEEVRKSTGAGLKKVEESAVTESTLSGLPGSLVSITGTAEGGGTLWFQGYATLVGKTLYQVLIEALNGSEAKRGEEIDALKRGFRLLAGAGPEEQPAEVVIDVPRKPAAAPDKPAAGGDQPAPGGGKPADKAPQPGGVFPPDGPKLEGRTAVFPSHNLRWTLPDGSPFAWTSVTKNEKEPQQQLVVLRAETARKEVKDGEPNVNIAVVALSVRPLEVGVTSDVVVNDSGLQKNIIKEVFDGKIDTSKTKVDLDRKVGNFTGSSVSMAGGVDKTIRHFTFLAVCLKSIRYSFEVQLVGGQDVRETFGQALGALLGGVEFVDLKEHVRGPVSVPGVVAHNAPRGKGAEKETEFTVPGVTGKKPAGLAEVDFVGKADPELRVAYEARAADGQAYFYFDVHTYDVAALQRSKQTVEDIVAIRETAWRTSAGEDAVTVTKGKTPYFDSTFAGLKGLGYHFTGSHGGHPFVELGWVVKSKSNVLWIRMQLGGVEAEKSMDAYVKAMKKVKPT